MRRTFGLIALLLLCSLPADAQTSVRSTDEFPGDLSAKISAADRALGGQAGTIRVTSPGTLGTALTLGAGHALRIEAPVAWNAQVTLAGDNLVACSGPAATLTMPGGFTPIRAGTRGDTIRDCRARSRSAVYFIDGGGSDGLQILDNDLDEMGIVITSSAGVTTTQIKVEGNSSSFAATAQKNVMGAYLLYVRTGVVSNNIFHANLHGAEWWGGDANGGWTSWAGTDQTKDLTFSGNVCKDVFQSCIWGSMGAHISVTGNTANGCGDVCFDAEGGLDTVFSGNVATACGYACYAVFFESLNVSFVGNTGYGNPTAAMAVLKHPSGYGPSHFNVSWSGNSFTCAPKVCGAFYSEGQSGPIFFDRNQVVDGVVGNQNYSGDLSIAGNHFYYTQPLGKGGIAIAPNRMVNRSQLSVLDNWIESVPAQAADTTCIAVVWQDYNNYDFHSIERNHCIHFGTDLVTENSGQNPGPHGVWFVRGNTFFDSTVIHRAVTPNDIYNFYPDNVRGDGSLMPPAGRQQAPAAH